MLRSVNCIALKSGRHLNCSRMAPLLSTSSIINQRRNIGLETIGATALAATVIGIGQYWRSTSSQIRQPRADENRQTHVLDDGSRVAGYMEGRPLFKYYYHDAKTQYEAVRRGHFYGDGGVKRMLGYRDITKAGAPWTWFTYDEALKISHFLSMGFRELEIPTGQDVRIGIFARNSPQWMMTEIATHNFNNVSVPLYATLGKSQCLFIAQQTETPLIVCDDDRKMKLLAENASDLPNLKYVVYLHKPSDDVLNLYKTSTIKPLSFGAVVELGEKSTSKLEHTPPKPHDISCICYTSGTTGRPKGVILTHRNVMAPTSASWHFYHKACADDVLISYLPLAHVFERLVEILTLSSGGRIGYFRGEIPQLMDDIKTLRPTLIPMVPRVLSKIRKGVIHSVSQSPVKKFLYEAALKYKSYEAKRWVVRNNSLADRLVFGKVRQALGGRVEVVIVGSAPSCEDTLTFARRAFGCTVLEGYGQTECGAAATATLDGDDALNTVGIPVPCCNIKLIDVPDLGYFVKDNKGEICIRGPHVSPGYYKDEELTKKTFIDGWLHTGDIGSWNNRGQLQIVDRKKNIFKLSQGEFVAPEHIENVYLQDDFVQQIYVHGETTKNQLVAIVVVDAETLLTFKRELNFEGSVLELCCDVRVKEKIRASMEETARKEHLNGFEMVKEFVIVNEAFSVENDLMTPTLKNKRSALAVKYADAIKAMYERLA